jgi:hypothetical protein
MGAFVVVLSDHGLNEAVTDKLRPVSCQTFTVNNSGSGPRIELALKSIATVQDIEFSRAYPALLRVKASPQVTRLVCDSQTS